MAFTACLKCARRDSNLQPADSGNLEGRFPLWEPGRQVPTTLPGLKAPFPYNGEGRAPPAGVAIFLWSSTAVSNPGGFIPGILLPRNILPSFPPGPGAPSGAPLILNYYVQSFFEVLAVQVLGAWFFLAPWGDYF
ncbi:MAG: hypothetical protein D6698_04995 [Gammaproteobacteria bacterium]|nr:MAG: hypothetical protein D6698_04995 [Gammaproteobacteria bacterium]